MHCGTATWLGFNVTTIRYISFGFTSSLLIAASLTYIPGLTDTEGRAFGIFALDVFDDSLHFFPPCGHSSPVSCPIAPPEYSLPTLAHSTSVTASSALSQAQATSTLAFSTTASKTSLLRLKSLVISPTSPWAALPYSLFGYGIVSDLVSLVVEKAASSFANHRSNWPAGAHRI